jgi:fructose-1,6-bisphosphatase I
VTNSVVTIERHIIDQERTHPEATGAFSNLLYDIALAAKMIAREVRMAGLVDILGAAGQQNASGDEVKKLDMWAHDAMFKALDHTATCVVWRRRNPNRSWRFRISSRLANTH